jgi:putative membrane protein
VLGMRGDPDGSDADRELSSSARPVGDETGDATRRTHLANERTQLAWWRTGLTSLAVGVGVGRVVPELSDGAGGHLAYALLGAGFVIYGILFILAGTWRQRQVESAVIGGRWRAQDAQMVLVLTVIGVALSVATGVLILVDA